MRVSTADTTFDHAQYDESRQLINSFIQLQMVYI